MRAKRTDASTLSLHAFPGLSRVPGLAHAVTTRAGGTSVGACAHLNLGLATDDRPEAVRENRRRVTAHLGFDSFRTLSQVHGRRIVELDDDTEDAPEADAWLVRSPGLLAAVLGADCPLVLVADPTRRAFVLAHSGWKGTVRGVVPAAVERLGGGPQGLHVAIGPAIGPAHYEVGAEVVEAFTRDVPEAEACLEETRDGHARLDLVRAIRAQLRACGVPEDRVEVHGACTYDASDEFFSYRRDGAKTGRHAFVAGWLT